MSQVVHISEKCYLEKVTDIGPYEIILRAGPDKHHPFEIEWKNKNGTIGGGYCDSFIEIIADLIKTYQNGIFPEKKDKCPDQMCEECHPQNFR